MLVPVLRFNRIARQGRSTRERHVTIMIRLGIGTIIGGMSSGRRAPQAAPIRFRTVLSSPQASLGAILHGQPLSGIWKPHQGSVFFIRLRFGLATCWRGPGSNVRNHGECDMLRADPAAERHAERNALVEHP